MTYHYSAGTDSTYYGHTNPPTSFRCSCGRWFLTDRALDAHLAAECGA